MTYINLPKEKKPSRSLKNIVPPTGCVIVTVKPLEPPHQHPIRNPGQKFEIGECSNTKKLKPKILGQPEKHVTGMSGELRKILELGVSNNTQMPKSPPSRKIGSVGTSSPQKSKNLTCASDFKSES